MYYLTAREAMARGADERTPYPDVTARTASGSRTGYPSFDAGVASASRKTVVNPGSAGPLTNTLDARNLQPGTFDPFVTRSSFTGGGFAPIMVRPLIPERALDPANGGALPPLNFAVDGAAPTTAAVTFGNASGESFCTTQAFITADGLNALFSASAPHAVTSRTWYGVPAAPRMTGDLHQIVATTNTPNARRRAVIAVADAAAAAARTLDFGPPLAPPNVLSGTGGTGGAPPWVAPATGTLPPDHAARASMYLRETQPDPRALMIVQSRGRLGAGSTYEVATPDLTATTGFTAFWNLRRGGQARWTMTGGEGCPESTEKVFCIEVGIRALKPAPGAVYRSAQATGTAGIP